MIQLEAIRLVQFFLFERQEFMLSEINGLFGENGSGKSAVLDAIQIAMFGGNQNKISLNAQVDGRISSARTIRAYCLGETSEHERARDRSTTYVTLIFRDQTNGEPISIGVAFASDIERDGHEVLGRYVIKGVELSLGDHLETEGDDERPREWASFREDLHRRARAGSTADPLHPDATRYMQAMLLALRGSGGATQAETFARAFRFALRMRFEQSVDSTVRNDVLEPRPTNIKKFREVNDSFRNLAALVAELEQKILDAKEVKEGYDKAKETRRRVETFIAITKMVGVEVAREEAEKAGVDKANCEEALQAAELARDSVAAKRVTLLDAAKRQREIREAHSSHKDVGALRAELDSLQSRAAPAQKQLAALVAHVCATLENAAKLPQLEKVKGAVLKGVHAVRLLPRSVDTRDFGEVAALVKDIQKATQTAINESMGVRRDLEGRQRLLNEEKSKLDDALARVRQGKAPLSWDASRLRGVLADNGLNSIPVCDLIRIADPEWQPAIEAYLKQNLEALLVPAGSERAAFKVYRQTPGVKEVNIVFPTEGKGVLPSPQASQVAALVTGDDDVAVAYVRRKLGDLYCADTVDEALGGRRTLTKDGMLVSGNEFKRLAVPAVTEFKVGGTSAGHREALERDLRRLSGELSALEDTLEPVKRLFAVLSAIVGEQGPLAQIPSVAEKIGAAVADAQKVQELLETKADAAYLELSAEEARLEQEASALNAVIEEAAREIGACSERKQTAERLFETANARVALAGSEADAARRSVYFDADVWAKEWDALLEAFGTDYAAMARQASKREAQSSKLLDDCKQRGTVKLGAFSQKHGEVCPPEVQEDWERAANWVGDILHRLEKTELVKHKAEMDAAYRTSRETFRNDVAIALNANLAWLSDVMDRLNDVLRTSPAFANGERYRFKRTLRTELAPMHKFIQDIATYGPAEDLLEGAGAVPDAFRQLLEEKVSRDSREKSPLDDYREFFDFDIEVLREDPATGAIKPIGLLSKRVSTASGGEHRSPLYVIAGAALAAAYRLDKGPRDGLRLMLLDEAFEKMSIQNVVATMQYFEALGLQIVMAGPPDRIGLVSAYLTRYYDMARDVENAVVTVEGHSVSEAVRLLMRADLPEFNPDLVLEEMQNNSAVPRQLAEPIE